MISVLLPYRDAVDTLEEALASVLADGERDLEIVAIDDGSRDESRALVERMARGDSRIVPVSTRGIGIAGALNYGLDHARGEIIARMDADDISLPGRFALQRSLLERDPRLAAVGSRVDAFPAIGDGLAAFLAWQNALVTPEEHAAAIFVESPLCHPSVMIARAALDRVGGFREGPFPEDYDLWLRFDEAGYRLAKVDRILLRWRHRADRATFSDPRCSLESFLNLRARHLARRLTERAERFAIWGAGKTGRRLARALESHGRSPEFFVDIDPRKIGRRARGAEIRNADDVTKGGPLIVVAVGARGARDIVRRRLFEIGLLEGTDFLCAA